jgi:hypothetical protein
MGSILDSRRRELKLYRGLIVFAALFLALVAMGKSKRYEVSFASTVQAGSIQVKQGTYQMEVEGGMATLFQGNKEVAKIPVRSEEVGNKKIEVTRLGLSGDKLVSIELGGTKTKLNVASE